MKNDSNGKLLRIYIGEMDKIDGQILYEAIIQKTHKLDMAGATVIRGIEGFGGSRKTIHTAKILRLSEDLPILIEIVDTEEKIKMAIKELEIMIEKSGAGVLMTLEQVEIIRYHK